MFQKFFDTKYKESYQKNIEEVRKIMEKSATSRDFKQLNAKIKKYAEKLGIFTVEQIRDEIKKSDIVASFFAKDPLKQNFSEFTMREFYEKETKTELKKPADMRFHKGELLLERKRVVGGSKSVDFVGTTTNAQQATTSIYYWFKYIGSSGGSQDNQYEDVVSTIREVEEFIIHNPKNTIKFCMVIAGGYFTDTKIKSLQTKIKSETFISIINLNLFTGSE